MKLEREILEPKLAEPQLMQRDWRFSVSRANNAPSQTRAMLSERQATSNKLHSLAWVAALFTDGMPSSSPAFPRSRKILRVTEARPDRTVVKLPQPTHRPVLRGFSLVLYSAGRRRLRDSIM
ncbi:MAG: hypothetical protein Q9203_002026 [Teloschistes exilis]